jgi:hypothetical protein
MTDFTGKVVALKLTTGEELIARATGATDQTFAVRRPLTLVMTVSMDNEQQGEVSFAPWMIGVSPEAVLEIPHAHIIAVGLARPDASHQYQEATGDRDVVQATPPKARGVSTKSKASR